MFKRSLLTIVVCAAACVPLFWAQASRNPDLPPGDMQAAGRVACLECHDARIILQQRLSKATWAKEVDKMIKWGAVVDAKDRDGLIEYLSVNFPPEKAAEPSPRVPPATKH